MALINADELMKWCNNHYDFEVFTVGYFAGIIQDSPTVDAIPVDWIKKYAEEHPSCIQEFRYMLVDWEASKRKV